MILRKSFYIRWSAGRSPRVHEVNPGRDPSLTPLQVLAVALDVATSRYCRDIGSNILRPLTGGYDVATSLLLSRHHLTFL